MYLAVSEKSNPRSTNPATGLTPSDGGPALCRSRFASSWSIRLIVALRNARPLTCTYQIVLSLARLSKLDGEMSNCVSVAFRQSLYCIVCTVHQDDTLPWQSCPPRVCFGMRDHTVGVWYVDLPCGQSSSDMACWIDPVSWCAADTASIIRSHIRELSEQ